MRRAIFLIALFATLGVLAGCKSTPASNFYTLSAVTEPVSPPSSAVVVVGPVSIPSTVDRPQIVVTTGPNQVRLDEFNRWAAPLQYEVARIIAEDLIVMLGTPKVTVTSHGGGDGLQYQVLVEVQRFESQPGTAATLEAAWTVRRAKDGKTAAGHTSVREPVQQAGYEALAAAHSRALARLAQDIAVATRSLEASPPS